MVTYLAYCLDKGLWKAIDYLNEGASWWAKNT